MPCVIPLRCACGAVTGRLLDGSRVFRNICHCRGCQAYARWLGLPALLDDAGGTDIYQITPRQLRLDRGTDRVRCVRLTDRGALRWYTSCCRTPVANSLDRAWLPWLGLPHLMVDGSFPGGTRAPALGPVRWRIHARHALRPVPGAHPTGPASLVLRTLWSTLLDAASGKARPHPFFVNAQPIRAPITLDDDERHALGLGPEPGSLAVRGDRALGCG